MLDAGWLQAFRRKLRSWYVRHRRDMPWRGVADPYAIWLSEIMLQQTQVATATPYFERFLKAMPTIESLARADEQEVLRLWEGLGYYRRARQLHQAAKLIVQRHGGRFPRDLESLRRLPGIGRYTAGAILSIAFDQRCPILEANTVRLLSRLLAYSGDTASSAGQKLLWAAADEVLPSRQAGQFNQALMELGSEVCRRVPQCDACPVAPLCRARAAGLQAKIPRTAPKPPLEDVCEAAALIRRNGRVFLIQWPEGRRWAGLWDFPRFPIRGRQPSRTVPGLPASARRELVENVRAMTGMTVRPGDCVKTLRHGVTRFRITLDCYEAEYVSRTGRRSHCLRGKWLRPAEFAQYPLSSTGRKLANLVLMLDDRGAATR